MKPNKNRLFSVIVYEIEDHKTGIKISHTLWKKNRPLTKRPTKPKPSQPRRNSRPKKKTQIPSTTLTTLTTTTTPTPTVVWYDPSNIQHPTTTPEIPLCSFVDDWPRYKKKHISKILKYKLWSNIWSMTLGSYETPTFNPRPHNKVRIFWEGHDILQNLHLTFVYLQYIQTKVRWRFRKMLWPSQNI